MNEQEVRELLIKTLLSLALYTQGLCEKHQETEREALDQACEVLAQIIHEEELI